MTDLATTTVTDLSIDNGDHELLAHIVNTPKGVDAGAAILEASLSGTPIYALCGKAWVPQRDPSKFPVCQGCIDAYETLTGKPWTGRR